MDERPPSRSRSYDEPLARALGRTIKVLRTDFGLERKELAERAEISYSYLTEIENGTKPASNSILGPIAEALGLQLFELIAAAEERLESEGARSPGYPGSGRPPSGKWTAGRSSGGSRGSEMDVGPDMQIHYRLPSQAFAPPSTRKSRALRLFSDNDRKESPTPAHPTPVSPQEVLRELEALIPRLGPDDQLRVLDLVRRLAR